jgi:hypothetical protein
MSNKKGKLGCPNKNQQEKDMRLIVRLTIVQTAAIILASIITIIFEIMRG